MKEKTVNSVTNYLMKNAPYKTFLALFKKQREVQRMMNDIEDKMKILRLACVVFTHEGKLYVEMCRGDVCKDVLEMTYLNAFNLGENCFVTSDTPRSFLSFDEFRKAKKAFEEKLNNDARRIDEIMKEVDAFFTGWAKRFTSAMENDRCEDDWLRIKSI